MAESQVPYPNLPQQIAAIRTSLSEPRFATYLTKSGGDEAYAVELYLYNTRVAKAFMFPLGVVEVALRNAIDALLVSRHNADWHLDSDFRQNVLMTEGLNTLDKAINRAGLNATHGQVVAELTFDFWSNLLRPDYGDLWRTSLNIVFPNILRSTTRHDVQVMAKDINRFRNRVAHHEPILDSDFADIHSKIVGLVSLLCSETTAWLKHHSTVSIATRTRPRGAAAGFVSLATRLAPDYVKVTETTTLDFVAERFERKCQVAICVDDKSAPVAAFGALDLLKYLAKEAKKTGGLVAPSEHTVKDLLGASDVNGAWITMPASDPLASAVERLTQKEINLVIGLDAGGGVAGVIPRALRRY
jgi:CBS domain-containing protein